MKPMHIFLVAIVITNSMWFLIAVEIARKYGMSPEQFGENLRDNYHRNEVEQDPTEPEILAEEFINK